MRPVVFLDVDGVLNAVPYDRDPEGFDDFERAQCLHFWITYSKKMGERLAALDADLMWLSTWGSDANNYIGPLFGWYPLGVVGRSVYDRQSSWWKSFAARRFLADYPRPFIWLDDDLTLAQQSGAIDWVDNYKLPKLLIAPVTHRGLLPEHLERIETWIADLGSGAELTGWGLDPAIAVPSGLSTDSVPPRAFTVIP
jgi:hypothetical protein